jgi:type VI secretion system FHA domain protein
MQGFTDSTTTQESHAQAYTEAWQMILEGAGLPTSSTCPPADLPAHLHTAGALLRAALDGLRTLLQGRTALKSHLRTPVTTMQAVHNNPLKVADAAPLLPQLLAPPRPGYLDGVTAVQQGYADLMQHELALTAGLQAAVQAVLARLAPPQFAPAGRGRARKAQCWEAYQAAYAQVAAEAEETLFGVAFVQAYEAQLEKLRSVSEFP